MTSISRNEQSTLLHVSSSSKDNSSKLHKDSLDLEVEELAVQFFHRFQLDQQVAEFPRVISKCYKANEIKQIAINILNINKKVDVQISSIISNILLHLYLPCNQKTDDDIKTIISDLNLLDISYLKTLSIEICNLINGLPLEKRTADIVIAIIKSQINGCRKVHPFIDLFPKNIFSNEHIYQLYQFYEGIYSTDLILNHFFHHTKIPKKQMTEELVKAFGRLLKNTIDIRKKEGNLNTFYLYSIDREKLTDEGRRAFVNSPFNSFNFILRDIYSDQLTVEKIDNFIQKAVLPVKATQDLSHIEDIEEKLSRLSNKKKPSLDCIIAIVNYFIELKNEKNRNTFCYILEKIPQEKFTEENIKKIMISYVTHVAIVEDKSHSTLVLRAIDLIHISEKGLEKLGIICKGFSYLFTDYNDHIRIFHDISMMIPIESIQTPEEVKNIAQKVSEKKFGGPKTIILISLLPNEYRKPQAAMRLLSYFEKNINNYDKIHNFFYWLIQLNNVSFLDMFISCLELDISLVDTMKIVVNLPKELHNRATICRVDEMIRKIPENREHFMNEIIHMFKGDISYETHRQVILENLISIIDAQLSIKPSVEELQLFVRSLYKYLMNYNINYRVEFVTFLLHFPPREITAQFLEKFDSILTKSWSYLHEIMLSIFPCFSKNDRSLELFEKIFMRLKHFSVPYFHGNLSLMYDILDRCHKISNIKFKDFENAVETALQDLEKFKKDCDALVPEINPNDLHKLKNLHFSYRNYFLRVLEYMPKETRSLINLENLKNEFQFLPKPAVIAINWNLKILIPPHKILEFIQSLRQALQNTDPSILNYLNNPFVLLNLVKAKGFPWKEACDHMISRLKSETDVVFAKELARIVIANLNWFEIYEPLIEQAILTLTLTDNNSKNPYAIYAILRKLALEENTFQPTVYKLHHKQVTVGSAFRKRVFENAVTLKDLPKCSPDTLHRLFDAFINRFEQLEGDEKEKIKNYIRDSSVQETSLQALRKELLSDGYLYSLLMKLNEGGDQKAPTDVKSLACILKCLLAESQIIDEKTGMSSQEEMLLKMAYCIVYCSEGKSGGIALYYNSKSIPMEYKLGESINNRPREEQALAELDELVQKKMGEILTKPEFLQELIENDQVAQEVHQTCYVKNLIAHLIGFRHQLRFDPHTHYLYDRLIQRSRNEVLEIFYKYFTPSILIQVVKEHYNANPTIVYATFQAILEKDKELNQSDFNKNWDYDEDNYTMKLTDIGSLKLLELSGYLQFGVR